ncbi:TRAP transporter large permease [Chelativorans alearense]|uniref:TRAP transporter large permease n=1 Tax=Chelativorans alearense TaxID=2681495 RepID=UPI0013D74CD5|nr:TRAP transporter large permease subunit [Chelativorans alearense]
MPGAVGLILLLTLIVLLLLRSYIFVAILLVSIFGLAVFHGFTLDRIGATLSRILFRASNSWELSAVPMFVWMGEIALRTSVIPRLFRGLSPLVRGLPGGLIHTNVIASTLFAAVSGSSAATTATVGRVTLHELEERGFDRKLSIGSLAGAGTLGLLIPPSVMMIIYGLLAEVSILRLFAAGLIPGLMIAALYSGYLILRSPKNPEDGFIPSQGYILHALGDLVPIAVLIVAVIGAIYSGWATPSEAAAVGVLVSFGLAAVMGELNFALIRDSLAAAVPTATMICIIVVAASFLSTAIGFLHLPQDVAVFIVGLGLSPLALLLALGIFYLLLGLLLDGISIAVMTLPIVLPIVQLAGIDLIWFGVFLIILVELGQMTPPIGFNLFILQSITGVPMLDVARAAIPFFLLMLFGAVLIILFPNLAIWLPTLIFG